MSYLHLHQSNCNNYWNFISMSISFEPRIRLSEIMVSCSAIAHFRECFCPWIFWRILDLTCYHRNPLCQICILNEFQALQLVVLVVYVSQLYGTLVLTHWGRDNGRHFADDIFKCIFLNENVWIPIKISLKFVPKVPINNIPALVQILAWCRSGDKP